MFKNNYLPYLKTGGFFSVAIGMFVMLIWVTGLDTLIRLFPDYHTIKFNTSLCFIAYGTALILSKNERANTWFTTLTLFVLLITAITIFEYATGINLGIDNLVYHHPESVSNFGRMYLITAISFFILSLSLLLAVSKNNTYQKTAQNLFHGISLLTFIILSGYFYQVEDLFKLQIYTNVALMPAAGLFIISLFSTLVNPSLGFTGVFTGNRIGNIMARKLFPYIFISIVTIAFFRIQAHQNNWVTVEYGIALFGLSFLIITQFLVLKTAKDLNYIDEERATAQDALKILNKSLEEKVESRTEDLKIAYAELLKKEKKVNESNEMFLKLFELSPVAMTINEGEGFPIKNANEAFLELINRPRTEVIGKLSNELKFAREESLDEVVRELMEKSVIRNRESILIRSNGEERICLASSILFELNDTPRTFSTFLDITERKQSEERLRELTEELTTKIEQVNNLNSYLEDSVEEQKSLNEKLNHLNEEKDTIIAVVSHDLRNPISGIASIARSLSLSPEMPPTLKGYADVVLESCDDMMNLTNNLLDINRIERGVHTITISEFEVSSILRKLHENYQLRATHKQIELKFINQYDDDILISDSRALYRILENLLSNAIKFCQKNAVVQVIAKESENNIRLLVSDTGPGIQEYEKANLFKKFVKLSAKPTDNEPSTGLGLSIVKELSYLLKGEISVQSNPGEGCTFTLVIPKIIEE